MLAKVNMDKAPEPVAIDQNAKMPGSVPYIVGNEAAERFSFYGMRSILTLYMTNVLAMSAAGATEVFHTFMMAVYFTPLAGAWLADRWLGRYNTILYISLFYCLGHAVLAITEGSRMGLYVGLGLIALGSGGIKPCVSAFVGDQFGPERRHLLSKVYGMFYWSINFGSFFAFAIIPLVREHAGYRWAFGVPGILMGVATLIFWAGTPKYVKKPPTRETHEAGFWTVIWYALRHQALRRRNQRFLDVAKAYYSPAEIENVRTVLRIVGIFATVPIFWSLFDQSSSTWVLQGEKMLSFKILGFDVNAETMQSTNALMVMLFIPIFTIWLYPLVEKLGVRATPLRRMSVGMVLAGASFLVVGWLQTRIDGGEKLSIAWQTAPYALLTAGEVMLSTTGLEFAFSQAPSTLKSTIMSFWLVTVAIGNFLVAVITGLNAKYVHAKGPQEFYFYAVLTFCVAGVFIFSATKYRERNVQGETAR